MSPCSAGQCSDLPCRLEALKLTDPSGERDSIREGD